MNIVFIFLASTKPNHPVLKYFELLHVSDLRHKTISKIPHSEEPWTRQIHFHSLGRQAYSCTCTDLSLPSFFSTGQI